MSPIGIVCGTLGSAGAAGYFAMTIVSKLREGRYRTPLVGAVTWSSRPGLFIILTALGALLVLAAVVAAAAFGWLALRH